jgi:hypothetical protein
MQLMRSLLISLLVIAGILSGPAVASYAVDKPACAHQGMSDQDRDNCDVTATVCVVCSVGCSHGAIASDSRACASDSAESGVTPYSSAALSSVALAPEEAPPKRSII